VPWAYQVTAQDAENNPLTFSLGAHPDGMTIDPSSGLVSWTPPSSQAGQQPLVEVTASEPSGAADTESFNLPVVATTPNTAPTITSTPRTSVRLGGSYSYQVVATDPTGDPLTFSLPTAPAGMTIDAKTGLVSWKPTAAELGSNPVQVRVDDTRGGFAVQGFSISVASQSVNQPPSIVSNPPQTATVGVLYAYNLQGTDPDNDPLTWSLDTGPAGMSIDPTLGTVRWTPTADQLGMQNVVVRLVDGQGGVATQSYAIAVRSVNLPPSINSSPPTTADTVDTYDYAVNATDPDNYPLTFSLTTSPSGMTIDPQSGLVTWSPTASQVGSQNVAIEVSDGQRGIAT
jgi:hypothetical protein